MPNCYLCGHEYDEKDNYCAECGADLNDPETDMIPRFSDWTASEVLLELSRILSLTLDLDMLLKKIDDSAVKLTDASAGAIILFNEDKSALHFRSSSGEKAMFVKTLPVTDGIAWWVAQHGESIRLVNVSTDERFTGTIDRITGFKTNNVLCLPVRADSEIIGIIEVLNKRNGDGFTEQDESLLCILANHAAIAVKNARFAVQQRDFFTYVIEILVTAVESDLGVPEGHCWRIAKLANSTGRKLGLETQDLQDLYYAAALHDLGILALKQIEDTREDREKSLPALGADMIRSIDILNSTETLIRHHREHFDGSGYPDGLRGEEIPLGSRIIAVARAYEAAVSEGLSPNAAIAHIQEKSGKLFDPMVVQALLELIAIDED